MSYHARPSSSVSSQSPNGRRQSSGLPGQRRRGGALRRGALRALSLLLVLAMLSTSTPAAVPVLSELAARGRSELGFWYYAGGLSSAAQKFLLLRGARGNARGKEKQEKQEERDARVSRVEILPGDLHAHVEEQIVFTAVAYDQDNAPIGGVSPKWGGRDKGRNDHPVRVTANGAFTPLAPGNYHITAEVAGKVGRVTVHVREEEKGHKRGERPAQVIEFSTRKKPESAQSKPARKRETARNARETSGEATVANAGYTHDAVEPRTVSYLRTAAVAPAAAAALPADCNDIYNWNACNYDEIDDPDNTRGNPPGESPDMQAGNGNFQLKAPVLSLPGRGRDLSLVLAYNSRVWTKTGSQITFDIDHDFPAPGWSLGFGKMVNMGMNTGSVLIEPDGTRHGAGGQVTIYPYGNYRYFDGHTTDGSFINYSHWGNTTSGLLSGTALLPNGTTVQYGAPGQNAIYPVQITDANGNYLTITYVNNSGPRIQTITDTLGRNVSFNYDPSYGLLTSITGPAVAGYSEPGLPAGVRTLVRLNYRQVTISPTFNGYYAAVANSNPWVVNAIYYPATGTGYWFGDGDSYVSGYGMLQKVVEQRGMGFSASSLNDPGTVWPGSMSRQDSYNFLLSNLSDAPTYDTLTQTWAGMDSAAAVTHYENYPNATPRKVIVTLPNGTTSTQYSFNHPGQYDDGLTYLDETRDGGTLLQSSATQWAPGAYESPRPTSVTQTDERGQATGTEYSYGTAYNQVTETRNYDYGYVAGGGGNSLLRRTVTQYATAQGYLNRHIYSLAQVVEIYAGDGTRAARTEYQYDGGTPNGGATLVGLPTTAAQHSEAYNPFAPQYWVEGLCYCSYDNEWGYCQWTCDPGYYQTDYDASTDYRGNLTQVTRYANAEAQPAAGATVETRTYDITGNVVASGSSCCQQTSVSFTSATQYAYPQSETRGSGSAQLTTSAVYDFNTGLVVRNTDANGRETQTSYDAAWRTQQITLPTGATRGYAYNDAALTVTETVSLSAAEGGAVASQTVQILNGMGKVHQEKALGGGVWDIVDTQYDQMGRPSQQTRPYRSGEAQQWNKTSYDALGRVVSSQMPDGTTAPNGSATRSFYDEAARPGAATQGVPGRTVRVVDAWGRERWGRFDALERLVEVVEPDPDGGGSVASNAMKTNYGYNVLGKLTGVTQGAQTRSFKYDSLGRLTRQKLAEASATLDANGNYVGIGGSGAAWSEAFGYDDRSNLISRTDARGVRSSYNYNGDPLGRLQSIHYDLTGAHENLANSPIAAAPDVNYGYATTGDKTRVSSVTAGASTQTYTYGDAEGRLTAVSITLNGRSPYLIDYVYDSLGRTKDMRYPNEYGLYAAPRKLMHQDFDAASRVSGVQMDSVGYASEIAYNASSQATSLKVGPANSFQTTEHYGYNAQTGLLEHQDVTHATQGTLLNLDYGYLRPGTSDARTGQLTKVSNNLDHTKDRGYEYDAVGRLKRATGGQSVNWVQRYNYDRYGNRSNVYSFTAEQYVRNFFQSALNRQPNATEVQTWLGNAQTAYAQGPGQFRTAMSDLGNYVFTLQEYTNRGRTDREYVYDLYKAYLYREPDPGGWDAWTNAVPPNGRDAVRAGFAYSYEFALKIEGTSPYTPAVGVARDGWDALGFDPASNRIGYGGYEYDAAGNQTRSQGPTGAWLRYEYDAAGRLYRVRDTAGNIVSTYAYGAKNERLVTEEGQTRTYYVWHNGAVIAEYAENVSVNVPYWSKSYVYLGNRLLATLTPSGGMEVGQYHHPDRLGTRLVTNGWDAGYASQATLPFGTALDNETTAATNRRFTSYDRAGSTGLDYAVNRRYDSAEGRFTQPDPIGMAAASLEHPQTLNLYAYCGNDPINRTDQNGLFWGAIGRFFKKVFQVLRFIALVVAAVVLVLAGVVAVALGAPWIGALLIAVGSALAVKLIGEAVSHIREWINACHVPDFSGLSQARQDELARLGVTPTQWNGLKNKQRLGYFNITAAIAAVGLSLFGWMVDWAAGGILQDRVHFIAGQGATNLKQQVSGNSRLFHPAAGHEGYPDSWKQNVSTRTGQFSFSPDGRKMEVDIDFGGWGSSFGGSFLHGVEVLEHFFGHIIGGGSKTNPYNVAYRSAWECK